MAIEVFNRREIKYLLSDDDKSSLLDIIENYMDRDPYNLNGQTYKICNLYLDTEADELIRKSLEKPVFKEKIRLRSYGTVPLDATVYLESKKKFEDLVNKRRTTFTLSDAYKYFESGSLTDNPKMNHQVMSEIDYIMKYYKLQPKVFISYDRLAFFEKNNSDFRITIDTNLQARRTDLRLDSPVYGEELLPPGKWLMEAKAFKAFPLWFVHFLSERKIYNSSFSKYGTEYTLYKKNLQENSK